MSPFAVFMTAARRTIGVLLLLMLLGGATFQPRDTATEVRRHTRPFEFSFADWTVGAAATKVGQYSAGSVQYMPPATRRDSVMHFVEVLQQEQTQQDELRALYGDPELEQRGPRIEQAERALLATTRQRQRLQGPAEAILQEQTTVVLAEMGLAATGKAFPPVAFHFTEPPFALIVSPRHVIRQEANIQLDTEIGLEQRVRLEEAVAHDQDLSALVVPIGGYGTYPTMVQLTTSLNWVTEVVGHEWIHNYLTLRPLGLLYDASPELRTMNETAATLLGQAIGRRVLQSYYPELVPPEPPPAAPQDQQPEPEPEPAQFDFREEMRETRVRVDELLAAGEIEAAESYMEARRQLFWQEGYRIRKLNQAYFAFYGSYAAEPGGAAGDDPVGEAVRELWEREQDPVRFLRLMAWMNGPEDLARELGRPIETP